jgi:hypothetical protein
MLCLTEVTDEPLLFFYSTGSAAPLGPVLRFFTFMIIFTDSRTPWTSDQLVARPLPVHKTTQTQNKNIHISNIHALCGIQTHDPGFRPLGYRDRYISVRLVKYGMEIELNHAYK